MDSATLKAAIDNDITDKTVDLSIDNVDVGERMKDIVDYVDQEIAALPIGAKTSGAISQSNPTAVPLLYDINTLSYTSGKAYLPTTTEIFKQVICLATVDGCIVRANVGNTSKMFLVFNSFVSSITIDTNQMYRFTYIGFGTGTGGATDGYWKAELMN